MSKDKIAAKDPAILLAAIEQKRIGSVGERKKALVTSERSNQPVLLPDERDKIKSQSKNNIEDALRTAAAEKLVKAGVFWSPSEKQGFVGNVFAEDTASGLSALEADVIFTQVWAFLKGMKYSSLLLSAGELELLEKKYSRGGIVDEEAVRKTALELASVRDDRRDLNIP